MRSLQATIPRRFVHLFMVWVSMLSASICEGQSAAPYTPQAWATAIFIAPAATATSVRVEVDLPTPCHSVLSWGQPLQSGNVFYVDTRFSSTSAFCAQVITPVRNNYTLGALAPGAYQFVLLAWGTMVKSQPFSVVQLESYTPPPSATTITATTGMDATKVSVNVDLPDACHAVSSWGRATRIGNTIHIDTEFVRREGICTQAIVPVATTYELGALPPGEYQFVFKAWGSEVKTLTFSIMPRLQIMPLGSSKVRISWPDTAGGWVLEQSSTLRQTDWFPAAGMPMVMDGQCAHDVEVNKSGKMFFRLRRP